MGRGNFANLNPLFKPQTPKTNFHWQVLRFMGFDSPNPDLRSKPFEIRYEGLMMTKKKMMMMMNDEECLRNNNGLVLEGFMVLAPRLVCEDKKCIILMVHTTHHRRLN